MPTTTKISNTRKAVVCRQSARLKGACVKEHRGQLQAEPFTRITIGALPDNVLLEVFEFHLDGDERVQSFTSGSFIPLHYDFWHTLVHVCRRWRYVISASPRRLNLRLLCTEGRPVKRNIWPELPILIWATIPKSRRSRSQGVNNIVATLKQQHSRVCQIAIWDMPNSLLKKFAAIKKPFPALTHVALLRKDEGAGPVLPDSFLEGSAPRLRLLQFGGIPFPALGKLLLSTHHLFALFLDDIPRSGYISPDALVTSLSGLTRLKFISLTFQSPRSRADRESKVPPSLTRVVLPALASFRFKGDSEYLEDILSRMDTPLHVRVAITFFNQLMFDTPLLRSLIHRAETSRELGSHRAEIFFSNHSAHFIFFQKHGLVKSNVQELEISCRPSDWQLSSLAQLIRSSIPPLPVLGRLELCDHYSPQHWQDGIENAQWLELLRPFIFVKDLVLHGQLVQLVAPALGELIGERVTEVLPALQTIIVEDLLLSGLSSWQKEIGQFVTARQISGRPVTVHYSP